MRRWFKQALSASAVLLFFVSCSPGINETGSTGIISPTLTQDNVITLHYNERPPYLVTTHNGVGGLTGGPASIAFERSHIPFQWKQTPSKRQIYLLQQNKGRDCLVGWFKNLEREKFAKYTLPIYHDKPQVALARADNDKIPSMSTVSDLFSNSHLELLMKDGYSYGDFLDGMIAQYNPARIVTTDENSEMLKMVYARRADYFFIAPEEADGLIHTSDYDIQDFKVVHFTDITGGEYRYILCSMSVEDSIIDQINSAIRENITLTTE